MTYRPEIDGLRAIAVIAVVLYHSNLPVVGELFSGGFLGVDVFFVISGYLITLLILIDADKDNFSYLNFYHRRARRLLPVLFLVLFVSLGLGWWLMLPDAFVTLGGSSLAALSFVSNVFFLMQDQYAAESSAYEPLIHTWSLAVEEQYYLVYPALLLAVVTFARKWLVTTLVILGLTSFILSVFLTIRFDDVAFYLFPTRVWELIAGALLATSQSNNNNRGNPLTESVLSYLGCALILASFYLMDDTMAEPSLPTLFPVMGTVLLIRFSRPDVGPGKLLASRPFVLVGLVSYSLYLWHQPFLAFTRIYFFGEDTPVHILLAIFASIIISFATWHFFEEPARRQNRVSNQMFFSRMIIGALILIVASALIANGALRPLASMQGDRPKSGFLYQDYYGVADHPPDYILLGDSHAAALGQALDRQLHARGLSAHGMIRAGCVYIHSAVLLEDTWSCRDYNAQRRDNVLSSSIDHVIVANRYTSALEGSIYTNQRGDVEHASLPQQFWQSRDVPSGNQLTNLETGELLYKDILELVESGKQVTVIGPVPEMAINPYYLWFNRQRSNAPLTEPVTAYLRRNAVYLGILAKLEEKGVRVIYPDRLICDASYCYTNRNNTWLYFDDDHLSQAATDSLIEELLREHDYLNGPRDE